MALDLEVQTFANVLHEIEALLSEHGEVHWAEKITRCLSRVERSDAFGLHRFLSFFGGMGSLNDILLHRNGTLLTSENEQLHRLLGRAWELGSRLSREEPYTTKECK
jgi:hypothetical protein